MSDGEQPTDQEHELRDLDVPERQAEDVQGGLRLSWRTPNPRREQEFILLQDPIT
jgi:hypothetical protein